MTRPPPAPTIPPGQGDPGWEANVGEMLARALADEAAEATTFTSLPMAATMPRQWIEQSTN